MGKIENLHKKIEMKQPVIGTHVLLSDSCIAEIMCGVGYDFIWFDMEHTGLDKKDILHHTIACEGTETAVFVRIPWNDPALAKQILDMGVDGIIFPNIKNAEEARSATGACMYPPEGYRGFGPLRAIKYGMMDPGKYLEKVKTGLWKILQIEHIDGVKNLDEILEVPGVDTIVVGPFDLAASMGHIGDPGHPMVKEAMDTIARKTAAKGIPLGVSMLMNPGAVQEWMRRGVDWISLDTDIVHILRGAKETLKATGEMWRPGK